ncbi:MAG: hypothetical protein JNL79_24330 [Myxococcales bacterium]|nr:hypothetical protein [Myxococcales bacterium]
MASNTSAPSGRLTAKSQRQPAPDSTSAPTVGPAAAPSATASAFQPTATPSSRGSTIERSSARPRAMIAAPPSPCANRATRSQSSDGANAHAADAATNSATPPV